MNAEQRLNLISKIAQNAIKKDSIFFDSDELWLIGMLSDTTTSEKNLKAEIEEVKRDYPEYVEFLEKAVDFPQALVQDISTMNEQEKKSFNQVSEQIRWVKNQKSQAYRENRLEDAKNFQRDENQLRQISNKLQDRDLSFFLGKSIFSL